MFTHKDPGEHEQSKFAGLVFGLGINSSLQFNDLNMAHKGAKAVVLASDEFVNFIFFLTLQSHTRWHHWCSIVCGLALDPLWCRPLSSLPLFFLFVRNNLQSSMVVCSCKVHSSSIRG